MTTKIEIDLDVAQAVVFNQRPVSQELLDSYKGEPNQFDLLVKIVAAAQGVAPDTEKFRLFILHWEDNWTRWALSVKAFRKWLGSTHYSYESTPVERLAELFFEHLKSEGADL